METMTEPDARFIRKMIDDAFTSREQELLRGGGSGGDDGRMEARIAKLEAAAEFSNKRLDGIDKRLDRIDVDIRLLLGAMVAGFLGLAAIMAKGFHWIG